MKKAKKWRIDREKERKENRERKSTKLERNLKKEKIKYNNDNKGMSNRIMKSMRKNKQTK